MTEPDSTPLEFTVGDADAGLRLDAFLTDNCPDYTRNKIQADLTAGRVTVAGRQRPKSFKLKAGQRVTYAPRQPEPLAAKPQDLPLDIVYRDDDLVVIDKAAGMVVHPAVGHRDGTLVNALLHHCRQLSAGGHPLRPGIVHRLDRGTSGLMVAALNDAAHQKLAAQLQDHTLGRTYLALTWGQWDESSGTLTGDIGRHRNQRTLMAVVEHDGRPATTHYEVLEDFGFAQLCRIELETGRTHQIRVHCAHRHHPVVGDRTYGDDKRARGLHSLDRPLADAMVRAADRQMLHAAKLRLVHPRSGEIMEFETDPPADMAGILAKLRRALGAETD